MKPSALASNLILILLAALIPVSSVFFLTGAASAQEVVAEVSFSGTARTTQGPQLTATSAAVIAALVQNSLDAVDPYDVTYPPIATAPFYLEIPFLVGTSAYSKDARPPKSENSFTISARLTGAPATVTLTWDLSRLPPNLFAQLTDSQTKQIINLKNQPDYSYLSPAGSSRTFAFLLSTSAPLPVATSAVPAGTPPEPTPFVFAPAPLEPKPSETLPPSPAKQKQEEKSPIQGLASVLILVAAIVVAAAYILLRLRRKTT